MAQVERGMRAAFVLLVLLVLFVLLACRVPPPPPAPKPTPTPVRAPEPDTDAIVSGRVMLKGEPVLHYGLIIVADTSERTLTQKPFIVFHETGGRFVVRHSPAKKRQIVIAGPGFARRVLVDQDLKLGANDLGDVEVQPGFTIEGRILDPAGSPVAEAVIAIRQAAQQVDDPIAALALGNFRTTSDKQGRYAIHGVTQVGPHVNAIIRAWTTSDLGSVDKRLAMNDQTLDIPLEPAGTIEGTASRPSLLTLYRMNGTSRETVSEVINATLQFRIDGVPAGSWLASRRQTITVSASIVTTVQLP